MNKKLKLTFHGGVGKVTGANFLLQSDTTTILVDCGLIQGRQIGEDENRKPFAYDPHTVDFLFITHAHIDHIGRVAKLVREGFSGVIYSTPETKALAALMLEDAIGILSKEAKRDGKPMLYTTEDVTKTMSLWKTIPYRESFKLNDEFTVFLKDAGHILGSAMVEFTYNGKKIVFTGDLGNSPTPILKNTEKVTDADYIVMESVYGDRNHEEVEERKEKLKQIFKKVIDRKGTLIIPVFSLEKTQVLLHEINDMIEAEEIPAVPVFLDSPLAIKITEVYREMTEHFNEHVQSELKQGDDVFDFKNLTRTLRREDSLAIRDVAAPKIIIAGSGMSNGGRITIHEKNYLPDPKNMLLIIGYQVAGSMGRQLQDGAKEITLDEKKVPVRAEVATISGYSSHRDSDHLLEFIEPTAEHLKKAFVVMGEQKSALFLTQRLRDYLGVEAYHPKQGETVELEF